MKALEENIAYLREVLGVKYLPLAYATVNDGSKPIINLESEAAPVLISDTPAESLNEIKESLVDCDRCKLSKGRKTIVFGDGNQKARLMFIGEGPGEQEDIQGLPFVGPAGQLLTKMIGAMGLKRSDVYIANVVKCRPPSNRNPETDEIEACSPFLKKQIAAINPEIIVALGTFAAQMILQTSERISRLRGHIHVMDGRKVVATFHPSYLLRNPAEKKAAWADLQVVMKELKI